MINSEFGKNVKRYREALEMTQEELAIKSGYKSRATISLIESGKRDAGSREIAAIAQALKVDVTDLLTDETDAEQRLIAEYAQDVHLRRLILFAGANIPKDNREKFVDAVINTINVLNDLGKKG